MAFASHGQAYNNLQNYVLLNNLLGSSRPATTARLTKAGYRLMTRQEVDMKEGDILSQSLFDARLTFCYTGANRQGNGPWYVEVVFDGAHGDKAALVRWNELMTTGRGAVLDNVLALHRLRQYDKIEGPTATQVFYKNELRHVVFTGFEGTRLIKFTLVVNRGDLSKAPANPTASRQPLKAATADVTSGSPALTPAASNATTEEGATETDPVTQSKVYTYVEQMPSLPGGGGNRAVIAAIQQALQYPATAMQNRVEGRVFVTFTVNPQGAVKDIEVNKGLGSGLDEEAVRAVGTLPKFIPGKQSGQAVNVSFTLPVTFKLPVEPVRTRRR